MNCTTDVSPASGTEPTPGSAQAGPGGEGDEPGFKWPGSPEPDSPRLEITNLHPARRVGLSYIRQLVLKVLRAEGQAYQTVDLVLLDAETMRGYNRQYHGMDESTDHLGFQYEAPEGRVSGDIFICLDDVALQAHEYGNSLRRELGKVVVHGVLHLCGWNDGTPARRKRMHAREEQLLDDLDPASPLARWLAGGRDV
jgi:probable rRNA maturation factor